MKFSVVWLRPLQPHTLMICRKMVLVESSVVFYLHLPLLRVLAFVFSILGIIEVVLGLKSQLIKGIFYIGRFPPQTADHKIAKL